MTIRWRSSGQKCNPLLRLQLAGCSRAQSDPSARRRLADARSADNKAANFVPVWLPHLGALVTYCVCVCVCEPASTRLASSYRASSVIAAGVARLPAGAHASGLPADQNTTASCTLELDHSGQFVVGRRRRPCASVPTSVVPQSISSHPPAVKRRRRRPTSLLREPTQTRAQSNT
jgi:hypothetical protein